MKFVVDGMLGKLARWLRIIGNDVEYTRDLCDKELIRKALSNNRVLLTSDLNLFRIATAKGVLTFLVKGKSEPERLAEIVKRFNLTLYFEPLSSKCPKCGSNIEDIPKESIRYEVPSSTFEAHNKFWICSNTYCNKIYWRGSHWKNITEVIANTNRLITNKKG